MGLGCGVVGTVLIPAVFLSAPARLKLPTRPLSYHMPRMLLTFRLLRMSVHVYTLQLCAATASVILRGLKAPPTRVTLNWRMHLESVSAGQPMLSDDQLRAIQVVCHPLPLRSLRFLFQGGAPSPMYSHLG